MTLALTMGMAIGIKKTMKMMVGELSGVLLISLTAVVGGGTIISNYPTAFEIFKIENGFIIHGELEITRIDNDGKVIWQNGGADIFVSQNGNDDFEVKV